MGIHIENLSSIYSTYEVFVRGSNTQGATPKWRRAGYTDSMTGIAQLLRHNVGMGEKRVFATRLIIDGPNAGVMSSEDVTEQF